MEEAFQASLTQLGEDLKSQTNLCHRLQVEKQELEELHMNMIRDMKEDHANMIRELRDGENGEGDNYVPMDMDIEDWEAEANPQELSRDGEGEPFQNEDMDTETEEQGEEEVVVVEEAGGVRAGANPQEWRGLLFERFGSSFQERKRGDNRSLTKKKKIGRIRMEAIFIGNISRPSGLLWPGIS